MGGGTFVSDKKTFFHSLIVQELVPYPVPSTDSPNSYASVVSLARVILYMKPVKSNKQKKKKKKDTRPTRQRTHQCRMQIHKEQFTGIQGLFHQIKYLKPRKHILLMAIHNLIIKSFFRTMNKDTYQFKTKGNQIYQYLNNKI